MKTLVVVFTMFGIVTPGAKLLAQNYPTKPIHLIVTNPPGPSTDVFARMIGPKLSESLGQPTVVENRGGASGIIAADFIAKAPPDGYNLLFCTTSQLVTAGFLMKDVTYDPLKDFTPIIATIAPVEVLLVRANLPVNSAKELIAYGRQNPGKLTLGTAGTGSAFHMNGAALNAATGLNILLVPYKSPVLALQDAAGGQVDLAISAIASSRPLVAAGKLRFIAVIEKQRFSGMPDLPALEEAAPGFEKLPSWFAVMAPPKLPVTIRDRLNAEIRKAMGAPDVKSWLEQNGITAIASTSDQVPTMIRSGQEIVGKAVKMLGLKPE